MLYCLCHWYWKANWPTLIVELQTSPLCQLHHGIRSINLQKQYLIKVQLIFFHTNQSTISIYDLLRQKRGGRVAQSHSTFTIQWDSSHFKFLSHPWSKFETQHCYVTRNELQAKLRNMLGLMKIGWENLCSCHHFKALTLE